MLRVGLTGGIGSGKSAVAELLARHGAVIIDADLLAREAVEPGTEGLAAVVDEFGEEMLTADGHLDRAAMGRLVFSDPAARARLNAIVHPQVRRLAKLAEQQAGEDAIIVQVIPLLVETGQRDDFDVVVVVDVEPTTQLRRVIERDRLSAEDASDRIAAQASRQDRLAAADVVIDNSGSLSDLAEQVANVWQQLRRTA